MRPHSIFALPASILLLITSHTTAQSPQDPDAPSQWPSYLPPHVKFYPEDPPTRRRDLEAIDQHLRLGRKPVGVMKMSEDEGEKFYMEYWQFEEPLEEQQTPIGMADSLRKRDLEEEERLAVNASAIINFRPPFVLHTEDMNAGDAGLTELRFRDSRRVLAELRKRTFTCPTGTADCSAIGFPGSCCSTSEMCFKIEDTGLGEVGCCPSGASCGGTITRCDAPNTACPSSLGGGCCIPNFVCVEGGCAMNSSLVVVITKTFTVTASSTTRTSTSVSTVTSRPTNSVCPLDAQTCAASLGGGCCPTNRVCALSSCAPLPATPTTTLVSSAMLTTTATGVEPIRPNSGSSTDLTTTSNLGPFTCPTGFYACEAYYEGGCCRTGRDCQKISCPPTSSTTIINGGVTIVVPVDSAAVVATPTGNCAQGWETCAASLGGNCCPSGWGCGTASCSSADASSTNVLQKASPGVAGRASGETSLLLAMLGFMGGLVMI
ncbi:hypothetical protein B2J93_5947 [Marssonina coronariae]|uniref:GPI anchored protein n=1 Tax=Diplocarpon coronariae TaxID=2795749 RepID=A0A218ZAD2_9HELO|nr:hypothetical protein B2J93_5947 [Marssonina coronariae]